MNANTRALGGKVPKTDTKGMSFGGKLKNGVKNALGMTPIGMAAKGIGSLFKKFKGADNNKDKKLNAISLLKLFKAQNSKIKQKLQQKQNKPNTTVNKKGQVTVDTKQKGYIKSVKEAAASIKTVKVKTEQKGLLKSIKKTLTGADKVEVGVKVSTKGVNNLVTKTPSIIESFDALNNLKNPDLTVGLTLPSNITSLDTLTEDLASVSKIDNSSL